MAGTKTPTPLSRALLSTILLTLTPFFTGISSCGNADADGDGWTASEGDCDDTDANTFPGAAELCDGKDNNCSGEIDEGADRPLYLDQDGDGYGALSIGCDSGNGVPVRGDCDDHNPAIHPGAADGAGDGVDQDCGGTTGGDPSVGLSGSGYTSIQAALDGSIAGQTIWVGPGTYKGFNLNYRGKEVALRSTHFASRTTIDADYQGRVFTFQSETATSVLDGFTVAHGSIYMSDGAGISITAASPTIRRCTFVGNLTRGGRGAGIFFDSSGSIIEDCTFLDNSSQGVFSSNQYCAMCTEVPGCMCEGTFQYVPAYGGGIYLLNSSATVRDSRFQGNDASAGGAIFISGAAPVLSSCVLSGNSTVDFSTSACNQGQSCEAMYTWTYTGKGGGIYLENTTASILGAAVLENNSTDTGGLYLSGENASPSIRNAIVAYNSSYNLFVLRNSRPGQPAPALSWSDLFNPTGVNHNLTNLDSSVQTVEPGFLTYSNKEPVDLHLALSSPLIDAGDPTVLDADGSPSDMGSYGGPAGGARDLDSDGVPDYFWPGTLQDAPDSFDPSMYDCEDQDPALQSCL